jgi:hypothetical protein
MMKMRSLRSDKEGVLSTSAEAIRTAARQRIKGDTEASEK